MNGLVWGHNAGGSWSFGRRRGRLQRVGASSSSASAPSSQGLLSNPVLKAGVISGSMSVLGDVLAQLLTNRGGGKAQSYDVTRAARMGTFGLLFYGPYQHYWYRALEGFFPLKSAAHFLTKVTLNQVLLAPLVLVVVFSWNLGLQGQAAEIPAKIRRDFLPSLMNGWKFWVPAASVNFWLVPLQHQVLYMSTCSVLWTAYLSYSSNLALAAQQPAARNCCKGGKAAKKV